MWQATVKNKWQIMWSKSIGPSSSPFFSLGLSDYFRAALSWNPFELHFSHRRPLPRLSSRLWQAFPPLEGTVSTQGKYDTLSDHWFTWLLSFQHHSIINLWTSKNERALSKTKAIESDPSSAESCLRPLLQSASVLFTAIVLVPNLLSFAKQKLEKLRFWCNIM